MTGWYRVLRSQKVSRFDLESGVTLRNLRQAYFLDGKINACRDNVILVFHSLTGSADALGDWWKNVIGDGKAIDTTTHAVLSPNLLGSCYGTTGPAADGSHREFPEITPRDMARFVSLLVDELELPSLALVTGGSLGGMVALEYALLNPQRAHSLVAFASPAAQTAWAAGWNSIQRHAIALSPDAGLGLARMAAMMTYRTDVEFESRFGRGRAVEDERGITSYLAHHGAEIERRFNAPSYRALADAMDAHDIGRGRNGVAAALGDLRKAVSGPLVGVGIPGDNLYSAAIVQQWTTQASALYRELHSMRGHDAFLLEAEQVGRILAEALRATSDQRAADAPAQSLDQPPVRLYRGLVA
jgi:homoserine O-acetyltransferase